MTEKKDTPVAEIKVQLDNLLKKTPTWTEFLVIFYAVKKLCLELKETTKDTELKELLLNFARLGALQIAQLNSHYSQENHKNAENRQHHSLVINLLNALPKSAEDDPV